MTARIIALVLGLLLCAALPAEAVIMPGTWDSMSSDLLAGTWVENYGPTGPGHPGCDLSAAATDSMQWMLGQVFIVAPAIGHDNGDGTITYTTDYWNQADPGASYLTLGAAPTLWGDAVSFTNLYLTVHATIEIATGQYLGGTFTGGASTMGGLTIVMTGTLSRTGFMGDPPTGHIGTVDYLEVTIVPVAAALDIKPGSCPNPLNRGARGKLPVALLGSDVFDVTMVDPATLQLARADGVGMYVMPLQGPPGPGIAFEDVGTPYLGDPCGCHEMGGDGYWDLTMKYDIPALVQAFELNGLYAGDSVELVLTGNLYDGTPFAAHDCIWLRGRAASVKFMGGR